jgi:hypothetical protein
MCACQWPCCHIDHRTIPNRCLSHSRWCERAVQAFLPDRAVTSHYHGHLNYNVKLSLVWTALENVSGSLRSGDILSIYLYLLSGSNLVVGVVQGINGIMQVGGRWTV